MGDEQDKRPVASMQGGEKPLSNVSTNNTRRVMDESIKPYGHRVASNEDRKTVPNKKDSKK